MKQECAHHACSNDDGVRFGSFVEFIIIPFSQ
jgi:hypothetical protein